jgi:hypothetical protein
LVWGRLADQGGDLFLLRFGQDGLLAWTATAAPFGKPLPAALPVALDPLVDGVVVDAEHPRGLGLGHAIQDRSDGPVAQRRLRRGRQGSRVLIGHAGSLRHHHTICLPW